MFIALHQPGSQYPRTVGVPAASQSTGSISENAPLSSPEKQQQEQIPNVLHPPPEQQPGQEQLAQMQQQGAQHQEADQQYEIEQPQQHAEQVATTIQTLQGSNDEPHQGAPSNRKQNYKHISRSIYRWPKGRDVRERPAFLEQYSCGQGQLYNVNSFLGKMDFHGGKYYVPPHKYNQFLEEYYQAFCDGYMLFLTENYHVQPFRMFMELDFDWEVPEAVVEEVLPEVIDITMRTVQEFFRVPVRPFHVISMRTIHKVHINFPDVITTELLAQMCRDRVVAACREALGGRHTDLLAWDRVIDFSHGSFRLMGSRKPRHIQKDPPWVYDKAYYRVIYKPDDHGKMAWVPSKIKLQTLIWSSIFPTKAQINQFERSPAFLDMIYQDLSADNARMEERLRRRLGQLPQQLMFASLKDDPGSGKIQAESTGSINNNSQGSSNSGNDSSMSNLPARTLDSSIVGEHTARRNSSTSDMPPGPVTSSDAPENASSGSGNDTASSSSLPASCLENSNETRLSSMSSVLPSDLAESSTDREGTSTGDIHSSSGRSLMEGSTSPEERGDSSNTDETSSRDCSSSSNMVAKPPCTQNVKLTLKVMPWGLVKAWLRPAPTKHPEAGAVSSPSKQLSSGRKAAGEKAIQLAIANPSAPDHQELLDLDQSIVKVRRQLMTVQPSIAALLLEAQRTANQAASTPTTQQPQERTAYQAASNLMPQEPEHHGTANLEAIAAGIGDEGDDGHSPSGVQVDGEARTEECDSETGRSGGNADSKGVLEQGSGPQGHGAGAVVGGADGGHLHGLASSEASDSVGAPSTHQKRGKQRMQRQGLGGVVPDSLPAEKQKLLQDLRVQERGWQRQLALLQMQAGLLVNSVLAQEEGESDR